MAYRPIDGPCVYGSLSVTTTAQELKIGASRLTERKAVAIQPLGNRLYVGFDDSVTSSNGIELSKRQILIIEAGARLPMWAIADSGTIDVRLWELG